MEPQKGRLPTKKNSRHCEGWKHTRISCLHFPSTIFRGSKSFKVTSGSFFVALGKTKFHVYRIIFFFWNFTFELHTIIVNVNQSKCYTSNYQNIYYKRFFLTTSKEFLLISSQISFRCQDTTKRIIWVLYSPQNIRMPFNFGLELENNRIKFNLKKLVWNLWLYSHGCKLFGGWILCVKGGNGYVYGIIV